MRYLTALTLGRGFEYHLRHECLCAFILCLFCVWVATLRWTVPPSNESYQLHIGLRN
jgi:hypothetical protein